MQVVRFIILMLITVIIGMVLTILFFNTPVLKCIDVLMYRGVALTFIVSILMVILLCNLIKKKPKLLLNYKDIICIIIVFISINITFITLVPVTVERSVSVFTLCQIENKQNKTITKSEAKDLFIDIYVDKNDAFGKRFSEQLATGSIKDNSDGSFTLTRIGHLLVLMFRTIGKLYNADLKNLK